MIELLVSGEAGYGAFQRADKILLIAPDSDPMQIELPFSSFRVLFSGVTDAKIVNIKSEHDAKKVINIEKSKNRALLLFIMLIDQDEPNDIRRCVPDILESLLNEDVVEKHVSNIMLSKPLPDEVNLDIALKIVKEHSRLKDLISKLKSVQPILTNLIKSLDEVAGNLGVSQDNIENLSNQLASSGAIAETSLLLIGSADKSLTSTAKLDAFLAAEKSNVPNARRIVTDWFNSIGLSEQKVPKSKIRKLIAAETAENNAPKRETATGYRSITAHEAYTRAKAQIEEIKNLLRKLDLNKARRFMIELKNAQMSLGDNPYAAMSLCNISSYACDIFQYSFALETAELAIDAAPEDGRCWSQLAEAYIGLSNFELAEDALIKADLWGEHHFAASSRARIFHIQGETERAISAYLEVIEEYSDTEEVFNSYCGLGNIYRELEKFDESLSVFDEALEHFEFAPMCWEGKGRTLEAVGRLEEALDTYKQAALVADKSVYILFGLGRVYLEIGELQKAEVAFRDTIRAFPQEPSGYRGLGQLYRRKGNLSEALNAYQTIKNEFPYDYGGFRGFAETLVEFGKFKNAEKEYSDAILAFPQEPVLRTRKANMYKKWGKLDIALQEYSQVVHDFPLSAYAKFGQADLLKELGRLDDAIAFYNQITERNTNLDPKVCIAAIYVSKGDYSSALSLLPDMSPRTKNEWVAHHIRGMALLKSGRIQEAQMLFNKALKSIPFASQRPYFKSVLAILNLKDRSYLNALKLLNEANGYASNILHLHSFAGLNRIPEAEKTYELLQNDCPNNVIPLRDELAIQAGLIKGTSSNDSDWIFEQECNMMSLAVTQLQAA